MPFYELLFYLESQGDAITKRIPSPPYTHGEHVGAELVTEKGQRYVCSAEGLVREGNWWRTKFIWCRV
jgi:hypothetical protein